mgnify:FL=1
MNVQVTGIPEEKRIVENFEACRDEDEKPEIPSPQEFVLVKFDALLSCDIFLNEILGVLNLLFAAA